MKSLFLTGVTGAVGKEIIKELLLTTDDRLFVLVRRKSRFSQWDRMRKVLEEAGLQKYLGTRVHALEGDVTLPGLGLKPYDLEVLRDQVTHFYHIAAITALNGSREDCYSINLGGAQEALRLAFHLQNKGKLKRFYYFSTAYVAGSRQDYVSLEDELPKEPAHANYYESSKFEAEGKVREAMRKGLPVTIFRPSIVVGHSKTGVVSEFNVIYPFMKLFAHGMLTQLPTHLENSFNIVPIDFVVQASLAIAAKEESVGKTYHLVTQNPPSIGALLEVKKKEYPQMPDIEVIHPDAFKKESMDANEQLVYEMLEPYLGYLNDHLSFDTRNAEEALKDTGISFPNTDYDFLSTLVGYAVESGYLVV